MGLRANAASFICLAGLVSACCEPTAKDELTLGRVAQFEAELQTSAAADSDTGAMPKLRPIPGKCMDAALRAAEATYQRNLMRRRAAFDDPGAPSVRDLRELHMKMLVPTYPCVLEQRVGLGGEGGKWLCRGYHRVQEAEQGDLSVVSIGSRGLTSFEEDMNTLFGSIPDTFDPFMPGPSLEAVRQLPFMRIHVLGLMGTDELPQWNSGPSAAGHPMAALPELLREINREDVDVFKVDCEGCEYGFVRDIAGLAPSSQVLGQIQMEMHRLNRTQRAMDLLLGLERVGYRIFHAEPNPYSWPGCYEIALVHEHLLLPSEKAVELDSAAEAECADAFALWAAAIHAANWARKRKPFLARGRTDIPQALKWQDVVLTFLVSDYPCQLRERFGVWGDGGATVCMVHRHTCLGAASAGQERASQQPVIISVGGPGSQVGGKQLLFEQQLGVALNAGAHIFNPSLPEEDRYSSGEQRDGGGRDTPSIKYHAKDVCGPALARRKRLSCFGIAGMLEAVQSGPVALLRLDCNGCQFELVEEMASLYDSTTVPFGQIIVRIEEHRLIQGMLRSLASLGYRIFNVDQMFGPFELSFIHQRCL